MLTEARALGTEMQVPYELSLLACAWVHYHLAAGKRSSASGSVSVESVTAARQALAQAESLRKQLGALPASELGVEATKASAAIKKFEREHGIPRGNK